MKDFFGTDIKVGDEIAFMQTGYRSLLLGVVTKLTAKTVFIKHKKTNVCSEETKQSPNQVIVKPKKETWIITAKSESGDEYGPKKYDHEPTEQDKRDYIANETPEDMDIDGPGNFGSYVYLKIEKL